MQCIYCLQDKERLSFKKKEHVFPQSFGMFKNNFTLINKVCDDCNKFFGDNLEIILGRDTYEGSILRYKYKIRNEDEYKSLGKRSRLIIKKTDEPYKNSYVYTEYSDTYEKVLPRLCPQIGFLKKSGDYEYYLIENIPDKKNVESKEGNFNFPLKIIILGCNTDYANKILTEKGYKTKEYWPLAKSDNYKDEVSCEIESEIDNIIFRAVAKIGFNYLTYWQSTDFVLNSHFNQIRNYIRWGINPFLLLTGVKNAPFFKPIEGDNKKIIGHFIAIDWITREMSLVAHISLFNWITYFIRLTKDEKGVYQGVSKGHFFNIKDRNIYELSKINQDY